MHKPSKIVLAKPKIRLSKLDMRKSLAHDKYEEKLNELQLLMLRIQRSYHQNKHRAVILFEGWDAGGKGGAIKRLTEKLDPRGYAVYPIGAPSAEDQGRHYLYRFWQRLPSPGEIVVFDRSWYGRVLVERVDGYAKKRAWQRAYTEINEMERLLIDDGVHVVKIFMHISREEQLRRFTERLRDPYKSWKFTEDDIINHEKWESYEAAIDEMLERTSTQSVPWNVIAGNNKHYARVRVLQTVTRALGQGVSTSLQVVDPAVVVAARERLGILLEGEGPDINSKEETQTEESASVDLSPRAALPRAPRRKKSNH
ncbi:MAG: polyphosphate kinase [Deltaproteobacteria bacterium RIFOXYA12_FULL_58_15]|nr:MAG: polyphosphate kinase [Deltaproteobacteria bacterium RIFOXYA12_FULL_58_15]OGR12204.1 MAG: polyphosphate kinase [Deltaproteobacteria bacterium RIFOXYB12_FULL_58_9]